jgi:AraC-like DNA-binding protein
MQFSLIDILLVTSIIQALALAAFLLLPENIRTTSNRLLVVTLISFAAGLTEILFYGTGFTLRHPGLAYLGTLLGLLQAGTLYLYAKALMFRGFRLRKEHLVHTLLFWVVAAVLIVEYYQQPTAIKLQILQRRDYPGVLTSPLLAVAIHAVVLGYLYATIRAISRFGAGLRRVFSDLENKQLSWLRSLLLGYFAVWLVSLLYCLSAHIFKRPGEADWVVGFAGVTGFVFVNYLLLNALRQPVIFRGLDAEEAALLEDVAAAASPPPATVANDDQALRQRLQQYMREHRPHLGSNLTVAQLARALAVTPRELSRVLNQGFDQNFFEFISGYRLEEAKARLADRTCTDTILQVMYDAGFNSKSVFNTAFRKSTGMTPSQYRAAHVQSPPVAPLD